MQIESRCKTCIDKSCASKELTDEQLDELGNNVRTLKINKGETILFEGSFTSHVIYLKNGLVKETMKSEEGKELIFKILKGQAYLGMPSLFGDTVNHMSYVALSELEVCHIEINSFKKLMLDNAKFTYKIMASMCKENLHNYDKLLKQGQKKIFGRLADVLLFFALNIYESNEFTLPISQQEIANFVGISRESCTRGLSSLKQSGIIKMLNAHVEIPDIEKLKQLSRLG